MCRSICAGGSVHVTCLCDVCENVEVGGVQGRGCLGPVVLSGMGLSWTCACIHVHVPSESRGVGGPVTGIVLVASMFKNQYQLCAHG